MNQDRIPVIQTDPLAEIKLELNGKPYSEILSNLTYVNGYLEEEE